MRAALRRRWRKYRKNLARCRRRASEDAVHDLRVGSRRLLATLDALAGLVPKRTVQAATREVKKRTRGLGSLRDTQVQRVVVRDLAAQLPALAGLDKQLARDERRRAARTIRSAEAPRQRCRRGRRRHRPPRAAPAAAPVRGRC